MTEDYTPICIQEETPCLGWYKDEAAAADLGKLDNFEEENISLWIRKNTSKVCKMLGIKYVGAERDIIELLQRIERRMQAYSKANSVKKSSGQKQKFVY